MPFLQEYARPATLLVFRTEAQYAAFTPRLGLRYQATAPRPQSGGYTILGNATSYWDELQVTLRPVYTHEFVHSVLTRGAALGNSGEWLQEGLAVHYQLKYHPQANFREIVARGIANADQHLPLEELTNGRPIQANRYWQAATLAHMLMADGKYREQFPRLMTEFAAAGSTELAPQREKILKVIWEELTADWKRHCEELATPQPQRRGTAHSASSGIRDFDFLPTLGIVNAVMQGLVLKRLDLLAQGH
jgi:hypothetical protein